MNYNDGMVHTDFYDTASKNELLERAKDYSEGDENLYHALLTLWQSGIKTYACCKGHENGNKPYIGIIIDQNNIYSLNFVQNVCEEVSNMEGIEITFQNKDNYDSLNIMFINEEIKNIFLNKINELIFKECKSLNNYFLYSIYFKNFVDSNNFAYDFIINKDEIGLGFRKKENLIVYSNLYELPILIETIEETKRLPLNIPLKCDKNSIERLINVMCPNTFKIEDEIKRE